MTHLALFFTENTGLAHWQKAGILERETALYRVLADSLGRVSFLTYGGAQDKRLASAPVGVHCNYLGLPTRLYRFLAERMIPGFWPKNSIVKSNQVQGADLALRAARRFGFPFLARCGYLFSDFMERRDGTDSPSARRARALEKMIFEGADHVEVTSSEMRQAVLDRYKVKEASISVIPNFVDTARFQPAPSRAPRQRPVVAFVGRLEPQKNLPLLIEALRGIDCELLVFGDGPDLSAAQEQAGHAGVAANFVGRVAQSELAARLVDCDLFVMPSLYEGHPKALIEAMALGLPIVACDAPGIRGLLEDGADGLLTTNDAWALRAAVERLLADPGLGASLGAQAREKAVRDFSLASVARREIDLLQSLERRC